MQFPLKADDRESLATTRAGITEFSAEDKDVDEVRPYDAPEVRTHLSSALKVTGFSIAPGNPISARIYDKTAELRCAGRDAKREIEHAIWEARGWTGATAVVRVEFQLRSVFLDEVDLRNARELPEHLDALWQRCVNWLRMIKPGSATRRVRCALDPRWEAVRRVVFNHDASPIARVRKRGGATARHALGTTLSFAASSHCLERIDTGFDQDGVVLDEQAFVGQMTEAQAHDRLKQELARICEETRGELIASLVRELGAKRALLVVVSRNNAAIARFSSVDSGLP